VDKFCGYLYLIPFYPSERGDREVRGMIYVQRRSYKIIAQRNHVWRVRRSRDCHTWDTRSTYIRTGTANGSLL